MTETNPEDPGMDRLLRSSMAAEIPSLSLDFEMKLADEIRRDASPLGKRGRAFLISYGVVAALVSLAILRGGGLSWAWCAAAIGLPLFVLWVVVVVVRLFGSSKSKLDSSRLTEKG